MIKSTEQAIAVQRRRRESGKKGRAKAVRRWFKRNHGRAVEAHSGGIIVVVDVGPSNQIPGRRTMVRADLREELRGDFTGCRRWDEVHLTGTIKDLKHG